MVEVPVRQADGDRLLDGRGHGAPRAPEQPRDLLPGQRAGPRRQRHQQCVRHLLLRATHRVRASTRHARPRIAGTPRGAVRVAQRHRVPHSGTWRKRRTGRVSPYAPRVPHWPHRGTKRRSGASSATNRPASPVTVTTRSPCNSTVALTRLSRSMSLRLRYPGCVTTPKHLMRLMVLQLSALFSLHTFVRRTNFLKTLGPAVDLNPSRSPHVWWPVLKCRSMAGFEVSTEAPIHGCPVAAGTRSAACTTSTRRSSVSPRT